MNSSKPDRLKLIVIHGWGGTFAEAVIRVKGLFHFDAFWDDGNFHVDKRVGTLLRQLLRHPEPDTYVQAFQKLIVGRLVACCGTAARPPEGFDKDDYYRFPDLRLADDFATFGIPVMPGARQRRADQLRREALKELDGIMPAIDSLGATLTDAKKGAPSEVEARDLIREQTEGPDGDLVELLEMVRDMHETGGDMDTVSSAVLYAHAMQGQARATGAEALYGRDFRFVFINYHERLNALSQYGQSDVLMADLPIGAFPHFDEDVRALAEHGVHVERFEDHHPYTPEQHAMLEKLVADGLLGMFALSGPLQGEELPEDALKCGTDMVYESLIENQAWDGPGVRTLRAAAHGEDFVTNRTDLGVLMTGLIKGNACKVELAQLALDSIESDDAMERMRARGWGAVADREETQIKEMEPRLNENVFVMNLRRAARAGADAGGQAYGPGSDAPRPARGRDETDDYVRILMVLAVQTEPGMPRLSIGRACEYFSETVPEADYLFYCYGSSLMVARRLNQADLAMNLGSMMPEIGSEADGGHSAAAVCRPDTNSQYPHRLLGRVAEGNFVHFVRYMVSRMNGLGQDVAWTEDRSVRPKTVMREGGKKLLIVTLVAILVGILLVVLHPAFRRTSIEKSNNAFFPQIELPEKDGLQENDWQ
tara:strand:- start:989 stop:2944 length:1956 start_codon:yes stop_codon:yes gene_type:complete